jgi:hypothetical protein
MRQSVQVQLGQQLADCLRAPLKQGKDPADESLHQAADPWPPHGDRPTRERELPGLPVPVAISLRRIHHSPPLRLLPAQPHRDLFHSQPLDEVLDVAAHKFLQMVPEMP